MASRLASILVLVIVAATLIAGLIAGAQNEANGPVDLIVLNARVYTGAGNPDIQEALAVRGNQILKVGSNREIRRLTRAQTTVLDARGGTVVPGFVDTRVDLVASGLARERLDLRGAATVEDVERTIAAYAATHADRAWVEGGGWDASLYDKLPTRQALDALVPDRPAYIMSADARITWANSKALQAAGIARRTAGPRDGTIARDARTGEPTGIVKEAAQTLLTRAVPRPSTRERQHAIEDAVAMAHQAGVTSVHNAPADPEDLQILARLRRSGEMALRVYQLLYGAPEMAAGVLAALDTTRREYPEVPLFKTGGIRIDLASIDAGADRDALASTLASRVAELDKDGWQVVVSAADAAAVEMAAQAFELVPTTETFKTRRHRIETPEQPDADLSARLETLGVLVSVDPSAPLDPLASIADSVDSADARSYARLLRAAIDRFTSAAAYASHDDQRKGTLAPGMLADLVILSEDVFATTASELRGVKVSVTVFDGKVVYDRSATATTH